MIVKKEFNKKIDKTKTQEIITVSAGYVGLVVLDLFSKSFNAYKERDFNEKIFKVGALENTYATSAIVLTVLNIEAYRNRIFYLEKKKISKNVAEDLSEIIKEKNQSFPKEKLRDILNEIFTLRDIIVHNHIYEVTVFYNENWEMIKHRQKLQEGYGNNRLKNATNSNIRKTKLLKFNVQSLKIGFEELNTLLIFFDLLVNLCQKNLGIGHVPFNYKFDNDEDNLSEFLAYNYAQISNKNYIKQLNIIIKGFKNNFEKFTDSNKTCVTNNFCPICSTFGFHKPSNGTACDKCKFGIYPS